MADRSDGRTHIVQIDGEYPPEIMAEGRAVSLAVATGACDRCMHLPVCSTRDDFVPPSGAWCMVKKTEILEEESGDG